MRNGFYRKLAASNVRKNMRFFLPRILAETGLLGGFYIALTLAMDERLSKIRGGDLIPTFMWIGVAVLAILSAVLAFYANSFLMKQRKREFGLYNVLGLEKKHVGRVLFYEGSIASGISIAGGLLWGVLFYKICALLICRLLKAEIVIGFYFITPKTLVPAGAYFLFLDLLTGIFNRIAIARMDPVELLKSGRTGEKEPRVKWLLLIIGVISLGTGYRIALTTKNPLEALLFFFLAVLLVIIGTYCLFTAGSVFILRLLKKNRRFYYHKRHMPTVSGLLYRMKQNAVGLASVAILSTGILIMISTTVSLYAGMDGTLKKNYPQDMYLYANYEAEDGTRVPVPVETLAEIVTQAAQETGVAIGSVESSEYLLVSYYLDGDRFLTAAEAEAVVHGIDVYDRIVSVLFISEDTYRELTGEELALGHGEAAFCRISSPLDKISDVSGTFSVHSDTYTVKKTLVSYPINPSEAILSGSSAYGIVLNGEDMRSVYEKQREAYGVHASEMTGRLDVRFSDPEQAESSIGTLRNSAVERLKKYIAEHSPENIYYYDLRDIYEARDMLMGMYGTLLFLGILLGTVSLFMTVLILYYKQISEGYEDRERFQIMEKIGMSHSEVRRTISFQVLFVFFLPLVTAAVHVAFAFPMLERMLEVLALYKADLFLICTLITFAVFALVYALIYIGTSKTYYKIVK